MNRLLTIVASNRDRFKIGNPASEFFMKSLQNQVDPRFEILIVDGGSQNYEELKEYFSTEQFKIPVNITQFVIGEAFERARLNNVGIRRAKTPYIATTDVDIYFHQDFVAEVLETARKDIFINSKTLYWKTPFAKKVYNNEVDVTDKTVLQWGRLKKSTTAGGFQCTHINTWKKIRGFDEDMVGWGSEDTDLVGRASRQAKVKWLGIKKEHVSVFHQPHGKPNVEKDLEYQEENKKVLSRNKLDKYRIVNPDGWGGVSE